METKSGVTAFKNSLWVITIADAMKRCEIEANLDEMVLESQDLNILSRYNILKNFVEERNPGEDESVNEVGIGGHNEKESKSEDGDAELTKECERKNRDKVPVKTKRCQKKAAMQSSESLASAIKDMRNAQDEQRQND
ncbi:unnamed protein product [Porites evermanni]|uniref:Uncharacterized protein n=1 Tax=Porites evermanni TaxID=104178 RepID=A0ABN8SQB0_9CNID|nr:unnamed protein product [Porites evermanni]